MSAPFASVVVCTRNRSALLADACGAMLAMEIPSGGMELLIVDNASTDDTFDVADALRRRAPEQIRVVQHRTVGLSSARNRGIAEARGEVIAFIDDDAFPVTDWLAALAEALSHPDVLCAGGPVEPVFQGELPAWFLGRFLPYLTVWDLGSEPMDLRYNEFPRGANMAFQRDAFDRFGGFSTRLGRTGTSLLSCEETELCLRFERAGFRTVYVPEARVRHTTPVDRLTPVWMEKRHEAQGRSEAIVDWIHGGIKGLQRGLRVHRDRARLAGRRDATVHPLERRCLRRAARGYVLGALTAPVTVARYRPLDPAIELAPWPPAD